MVFFSAVAVALVLIVIAILRSINRKVSDSGAEAWPFYARKILTRPEQVLYYRLVSALPECIVLAQVQLSRALGVKSGFNFHSWNNRINRMSLDFLVCLKDSTIVAAVELDDGTHERATRVEADANRSAGADQGLRHLEILRIGQFHQPGVAVHPDHPPAGGLDHGGVVSGPLVVAQRGIGAAQDIGAEGLRGLGAREGVR